MSKIKHEDIWRAIDLMAEGHGLSTSGLAKKAGLDPTTFNPSKRQTSNGKKRWPSTESLAKVLETTGEDLSYFARMAQDGDDGNSTKIVEQHDFPLVGMDTLMGGCFKKALLQSKNTTTLPIPKDEDSLVVDVTNKALMPFYSGNERIVVSLNHDAIRRGDRLLVLNSGRPVIGLYEKHISRSVIYTDPLKSQRIMTPIMNDDKCIFGRILAVYY